MLYLQANNKRVLHKFQHSELVENSEDEVLSVECVALCKAQSNPALKLAASGGADGFLKVWDLNSGVLRLSCAHSRSSVVALQWHKAVHHLVFTAALDYLVRVWDARDGSYFDSFVMRTTYSTYS
jgi:WD40 repeat protein